MSVRPEKVINNRKIVKDYSRFRVGDTVIVLASKHENHWDDRGYSYDKGTVIEAKADEDGYTYNLRFDRNVYGNGMGNVIAINYAYQWYKEEELDWTQHAIDRYQEPHAKIPIHVNISNCHRVDAGFTYEEWEIVRDYARENPTELLRVVGNDQGWYPILRHSDDERIPEGGYLSPGFRAIYYPVEIGFRSVVINVYAYKDMFRHDQKLWEIENPEHTTKGKFRYPKEHHRKF